MNLDQQKIDKLFPLIDLTSLNDTDTPATITTLCEKVKLRHHHVAAVCVYPAFVQQVKQTLKNSNVKIATVANFPKATDLLEKTLQSIRDSIAHGADEIDVVFPYHDFLKGIDPKHKPIFKHVKKRVAKIHLKVILETGAIQHPHLIKEAAHEVFMAGADLIKTSTGKIEGATVIAAEAMLLVVRDMTHELKRPLGFKVSGGVRTLDTAWEYVLLAESIMGKDWVTPSVFRIGASQLVDVMRDQGE